MAASKIAAPNHASDDDEGYPNKNEIPMDLHAKKELPD
jgi:hypothetical protein